MNLSANISLAECVKSQTALRNNIDNTPNDDQIAALKVLAESVLQKVREQFKVFGSHLLLDTVRTQRFDFAFDENLCFIKAVAQCVSGISAYHQRA